jgi:hypothetical protein
LKRVFAIFFLVIFLFQVGGYYIVFLGMQHSAKQALLHRLDADNYAESDLIVLTIPLSLPYPLHGGEFERVDGEFEHQGQQYKVVKQKLDNDTLFIACIRDEKGSMISAAFSDFTKVAHNLPVNSKKAMNVLSKLYKDFKSTEFKMFYRSRFVYERAYLAHTSITPPGPLLAVDSPPPEFMF